MSGALTAVATVATGGVSPFSLAIDPAGKYLYVANFNSNNVSAYSINAASGGMSSLGLPVIAGTNPRSITVDPTGAFVYVANSGSGNVSAYSINPASGVLANLGAAVPRARILSRSRRFAASGRNPADPVEGGRHAGAQAGDGDAQEPCRPRGSRTSG